jgi:DNA invertase Pin-like site-specific DNA recombinase
VFDLSRLNRNTKNFLDLLDNLDQRGINLIIHNMGGQVVDSGSATGKMILTVLAAVETMNRQVTLEKQAHGIAVNKAKFKGKQVNPETVKKCERALKLIDQGISKEKASRAESIGIATLYRYIKKSA